MNRIKMYPAQIALAFISVGLAGATTVLYLQYSHFRYALSGRSAFHVIDQTVPGIDSERIETALCSASEPSAGNAVAPEKRLFASKLYVLKDGRLKRTEGEVFHPPVPNDWLTAHGLNLVDPSVLSSDPDGDGFSTLAEWLGSDGVSHKFGEAQSPADDSTNPVAASSHPPYHTRLALHRVESIPFRLKFMMADVNPRNPKHSTFQINAIDAGGKSHYVQLGQRIPGTQFSAVSYEHKEEPGPEHTVKDVSELTVLNNKTGEKVILPKEVIVDSPESYAVLHYHWPMRSTGVPGNSKPTQELTKRKGEKFTLQPALDREFQVTSIRQDAVEIRLPSGEPYIVRRAAP